MYIMYSVIDMWCMHGCLLNMVSIVTMELGRRPNPMQDRNIRHTFFWFYLLYLIIQVNLSFSSKTPGRET